ncbi:Gag-Pol polyprotein [Plakobranchus ocellatus]|uniref:Gag-Pol polyprotein n=1 Tax=Plakobranchus ocellatus TaxID=259542 RepID=A0AAV3ZYE4_9GAST|nr:Gag-Pol polyprotein [Plakobranchus ocellatus]
MSRALHLGRSTRLTLIYNSQTKQKKEDTSEVAYQKKIFRIKETFSNHYAIYTDGSKLEKKVAAAAYFPERLGCSKATRLKDGTFVASAELEGIAFKLTEIKKLIKYHNSFIISSDSLSAYTLFKMKISKLKISGACTISSENFHPMFTSPLSGFLPT